MNNMIFIITAHSFCDYYLPRSILLLYLDSCQVYQHQKTIISQSELVGYRDFKMSLYLQNENWSVIFVGTLEFSRWTYIRNSCFWGRDISIVGQCNRYFMTCKLKFEPVSIPRSNLTTFTTLPCSINISHSHY